MVSGKYQQGVVLIAALVMVLLVSGIAVTLMSSSSIDMKVTNAAQDFDVAKETTVSDSERAIYSEKQKLPADNALLFRKPQFDAEVNSTVVLTGTVAGADSNLTLTHENNGPQELDCPPKANPTPGIKCNMLQLRSSLNYGKQDRHNVTMLSGIAQEVAN